MNYSMKWSRVKLCFYHLHELLQVIKIYFNAGVPGLQFQMKNTSNTFKFSLFTSFTCTINSWNPCIMIKNYLLFNINWSSLCSRFEQVCECGFLIHHKFVGHIFQFFASSKFEKDIRAKNFVSDNIIVLSEILRNSLASWFIGIMIGIVTFIFEYLLKFFSS